MVRRLLFVVSYAAACIVTAAGTAFLLGTMGLHLGMMGLHSGQRAERARLDLQNIGIALRRYQQKQGRYPTTQEGLRTLVSHQMLETVPRDPWNVDYRYELRRGWPLLWSYGADGLPGGEGPDTDLYNLGPLP